jgi:hypothetical protein
VEPVDIARKRFTSRGAVIAFVVVLCVEKSHRRNSRRLIMRAIEKFFSAWLAWLCGIFEITPESLYNDRRGNQPPPTGGIGAF